MKHSEDNTGRHFCYRVYVESRDGVGETQEMEEKLQDAAGTSSCTISNAGMSTDRDSDEHDGSRHMAGPYYPAWCPSGCGMRSGMVKRRSALVDDWLLNPRGPLG